MQKDEYAVARREYHSGGQRIRVDMYETGITLSVGTSAVYFTHDDWRELLGTEFEKLRERPAE